MIPLGVLDGALGGTNLIYLVQNLLATTAFWLVLQAAASQESEDTPHSRRRYWVLGVILVAFSVAFLFIDRGPTSPTFIHDNVDQLAAVLCASIYLAGIGGISLQLMLAVRRRRLVAYWPFVVGGALAIVACINEIVWLFIAHAHAVDARTQALGYALFDPFFYLGVILIVAGILSFTVRKWNRETQMTLAIRQLSRITQRAGLTSATAEDGPATGGPQLSVAYDLLISIHDETVAGRVQLTARERRVLSRAEALVTRELGMAEAR
ncbi:hypothetical protein [Subtercola boreus]|uniref:hypothetical protein n=1 Tax=Subtercola boreus TaxID=120213 RepID=UPI0011C01893|nr:hypothetical protein [Subtercola boreus]